MGSSAKCPYKSEESVFIAAVCPKEKEVLVQQYQPELQQTYKESVSNNQHCYRTC